MRESAEGADDAPVEEERTIAGEFYLAVARDEQLTLRSRHG